MHYLLSIIVPAHNDHATLPYLLKSIAHQSMHAIEVIVVDDSSIQTYEHTIQPFIERGLTVRLIRSDRHILTKEARLKGLEVATSDIVTFADADDVFYGTTALEKNVARFRATGADLLHFPALLCQNGKISIKSSHLGPICSQISGQEIFYRFVSMFTKFNLWGKLYSRELWNKLIPVAKMSPIQRYCEDMYLFHLYAFHAKRYIGTNYTSYTYNDRSTTNSQRALGRMLAVDNLIKDFLPYLERNHCPSKTLEILSGELYSHLGMHAARIATNIENAPHGADAALADILKQCSFPDITRILMTANGVMAKRLTDIRRATRKFNN